LRVGKKAKFFMGEKKYKQVKNDYQKNKTKTGKKFTCEGAKKKKKKYERLQVVKNLKRALNGKGREVIF